MTAPGSESAGLLQAAQSCALDALMREGGPVRVEVRPCCLAALVGRRAPAASGGSTGPSQSGAAAFPSGAAASLSCAAVPQSCAAPPQSRAGAPLSRTAPPESRAAAPRNAELQVTP
ncbi:hypothetical protein ACQP2F_01585 [Actinoplanes sp. CA-030573]|uniref:hypothetical protein n=1 Tax=Actinoplanes sp. CA-030573 TaxID=3239898 RepID=UPI003D94E56F